jgi:deoxyadenosine/deoxycytidine kinase
VYVAVAGNIGAGKSTLTRLVSERFHLTPVYEAVDENPYLTTSTATWARYAFHSQMFFLATRLRQHLAQVNPGDRVIQDRTVYEDANVFARALHDAGVMDARDFGSYTTMYDAVRRALRPPDLLVYLRASLPTLRAHIAARGRRVRAAHRGRLPAAARRPVRGLGRGLRPVPDRRGRRRPLRRGGAP